MSLVEQFGHERKVLATKAVGLLPIVAVLVTRIRRANLDGSGDQDIVVFENQPDFDASDFYRGLAVDPSAGKIYWGVGGFCPIEANTGRIQRADLNGDNVENVVTGLGIVYKVVVVNPSM